MQKNRLVGPGANKCQSLSNPVRVRRYYYYDSKRKKAQWHRPGEHEGCMREGNGSVQ